MRVFVGEPPHRMSLPTRPTNTLSRVLQRSLRVKYPPPWSPLYHRHQRALNLSPSETDADNTEPFLTTSEPLPEHATALIGQPEDLPEILDTPTVTVNNMRHKNVYLGSTSAFHAIFDMSY